MKRFGLFFITNILIMITISIVIRIFGFDRYLTAYGLNYTALMGFCFIWGMAGAFISLMLSKYLAKMAMGVQIIDGKGEFGPIYNAIRRISQKAGIPMPEVGVYASPEVNAFATGASKDSALVAVSTGLLQRMDENEIEGVLAHEISHIANGDMVTLTLIQGVVNSFGMFLARIIGYFAGIALGRGEGESRSSNFIVQYIVTIIFDIVFSILGSMVVAYFSRYREFKADLGGAKLAGRENMIAALENLRRYIDAPEEERGSSFASLKISHKGGLLSLLSTHPPLEDRIRALRQAQIK